MLCDVVVVVRKEKGRDFMGWGWCQVEEEVERSQYKGILGLVCYGIG